MKFIGNVKREIEVISYNFGGRLFDDRVSLSVICNINPGVIIGNEIIEQIEVVRDSIRYEKNSNMKVQTLLGTEISSELLGIEPSTIIYGVIDRILKDEKDKIENREKSLEDSYITNERNIKFMSFVKRQISNNVLKLMNEGNLYYDILKRISMEFNSVEDFKNILKEENLLVDELKYLDLNTEKVLEIINPYFGYKINIKIANIVNSIIGTALMCCNSINEMDEIIKEYNINEDILIDPFKF